MLAFFGRWDGLVVILAAIGLAHWLNGRVQLDAAYLPGSCRASGKIIIPNLCHHYATVSTEIEDDEHAQRAAYTDPAC